MAYSITDWRKRLAERSDLTSRLVHLTRGTETHTAIDVLLTILTSGVLLGSTTESGFIVGDRPAACLQDAPLYAVGQNLYFETKLREATPGSKIRYVPIGLSFSKDFVFRQGGRPVTYGPTDELKQLLSSSRVVAHREPRPLERRSRSRLDPRT